MKLVKPADEFAAVSLSTKRNASTTSSRERIYHTICVPLNSGFVVGELYESIIAMVNVKIFLTPYRFYDGNQYTGPKQGNQKAI